MKLTKIEIFHFGKLNNLSFKLNDNLNIFWGNNEAGKSTTVAFIKQILFGFHLRNSKSPFFEDYFPLDHVSPMGGRLYFSLGHDSYVLERTYAKGDSKKGILTVELNGQKVPETVFFDKIRNIDGSFYTDSFIFNQDLLAEVNNLTQEELMERIYFLGASQSNKLLTIRNNYEQDAGKLFKKTGRKPIINQLLKQIEDQEETINQIDNQFDQYQELDRRESGLQKELQSCQKKFDTVNEQEQKLNSLKQKLVNFKRYQDLVKQYHPVDFSNQNYQKAKTLIFEIKNYQQDLDNLSIKLTQLEEKARSSQKQDHDIQELLNQRAEFLQWQSELTRVNGNFEQLSQEVKQLEEMNPELASLSSMSTQQLQDLKQDYQLYQKQKKENTISPNNIKVVGGLLAVITVILGIITKNWLWLGITIIDGIGSYYLLQKVNKNQIEKKKFSQKYKLDFENIDLNALLSQLIQLDTKKRQLGQQQAEILKLNNKISSFLAHLSQFVNQEQISMDQVSGVLNQLQAQLQSNQNCLQQLTQLKDQIQGVKTRLLDKKSELNSLLIENNVQNIKDFDSLAQEAEKQQKIKLELTTLKNNLLDDLKYLEELGANNERIVQEEAGIKQKSSHLASRINQLQQELAQVKVTKENLANSDDLFEEKQKLANLKSQLEQESVQYLSDLLVAQWISRSLDLASNERFPKMIESAREYFKLLTGKRYIDLNLEKKLTVTNANKKKLEVKYLSRGTSEQLYFALKLAFVEQIADEISLPILIDDAFVNFDNQRIEYISELLQKLSHKTQVLIFTQRKELGKLLEQKVLTFDESENK